MTIASILSDLWRGSFDAPLPSQELQKSPGGIGLRVELRSPESELNEGHWGYKNQFEFNSLFSLEHGNGYCMLSLERGKH